MDSPVLNGEYTSDIIQGTFTRFEREFVKRMHLKYDNSNGRLKKQSQYTIDTMLATMWDMEITIDGITVRFPERSVRATWAGNGNAYFTHAFEDTLIQVTEAKAASPSGLRAKAPASAPPKPNLAGVMKAARDHELPGYVARFGNSNTSVGAIVAMLKYGAKNELMPKEDVLAACDPLRKLAGKNAALTHKIDRLKTTVSRDI